MKLLKKILIAGTALLSLGIIALKPIDSLIEKRKKTNIIYNIKDEDGKRIFRAKEHVSYYLDIGGTIEYAKELAKIKDEGGKAIFNGWDILQYFRIGGDIKHAKNLVKEFADIPRINWFKIYRAAQLGLTKKELLGFDDTKKPNAVVVYPAEDWYRAFETKETIDLFKKIKEKYDVHVVFAKVEEEVYNAIDYIPNIELLILNGHGTKTTLSLGERDSRLYQANRTEKHTIDTSDTELNQHLDNLVQNAVIFLNSCSNASEGKNADNLANFIIKMTKNKKVFASTERFGGQDIKVNSIYPFDIDIITEEGNKTYTNKK